jgi:purine-nucleoside phosphorylase
MPSVFDDPLGAAHEAARSLAARTGVARHDVAIVLGDACRSAADALAGFGMELAQHELPGFPVGRAGQGMTLRSVPVANHRVLVVLGHHQLHEGLGVEVAVHPVRMAVAAGCRAVVLADPCRAIRADLRPGQLVLVHDHVSFTGVSPLYGPETLDLSDLYSARLRSLCRELDSFLTEVVFGSWLGPALETPAEVRMLRMLGCDATGTSLVPDAVAAHALGAEVLALGIVSHLAAGTGRPLPDADERSEALASGAARLGELLTNLLDRLADTAPQAVRPLTSGS